MTLDEALEIEIAKVAAQAGVDPAELRRTVKDVAGLIAYEPTGTDDERAAGRVQIALGIMTGDLQRSMGWPMPGSRAPQQDKDERLLQVDSDSDDNKGATKQKVTVIAAASKRTEYAFELTCPLCKAEALSIQFIGGLVTPTVEPIGEQPAHSKAVLFSCQHGHNFVIFVSGKEGTSLGTASLLLLSKMLGNDIGSLEPEPLN
jgi:hypothetical protein